MRNPHIEGVFSSGACTVLHRIVFPVVSEWYQLRHNCHTIVLGCGTHMKDVQHPVRQIRTQLLLDRYSRWMPSMGPNIADGRDESLG